MFPVTRVFEGVDQMLTILLLLDTWSHYLLVCLTSFLGKEVKLPKIIQTPLFFSPNKGTFFQTLGDTINVKKVLLELLWAENREVCRMLRCKKSKWVIFLSRLKYISKNVGMLTISF